METPTYSELLACLAAPEGASPFVFACGASGGGALAGGVVTLAI